MSFVHDVLPLIGSLIAIIAILFLTYLACQYISKNMTLKSAGGSIQILERIALTQDKLLVIARVEDKYYLMGVADSIEILKELDDYTPPKADMNVPDISGLAQSMSKAFKKVSKDK